MAVLFYQVNTDPRTEMTIPILAMQLAPFVHIDHARKLMKRQRRRWVRWVETLWGASVVGLPFWGAEGDTWAALNWDETRHVNLLDATARLQDQILHKIFERAARRKDEAITGARQSGRQSHFLTRGAPQPYSPGTDPGQAPVG